MVCLNEYEAGVGFLDEDDGTGDWDLFKADEVDEGDVVRGRRIDLRRELPGVRCRWGALELGSGRVENELY